MSLGKNEQQSNRNKKWSPYNVQTEVFGIKSRAGNKKYEGLFENYIKNILIGFKRR